MDCQGRLGLLGVIGGLVSATCAVVSVLQARKSKEEREAAEKVGRSLEVLADAVARQQQAPPWELRWVSGDRYLLVNTGAETIDGVDIECLAKHVAFGVEADSMPTSIDSHASLSFIYEESIAAEGHRAIRVHWMRSDGTAATWESPIPFPPKGS